MPGSRYEYTLSLQGYCEVRRSIASAIAAFLLLLALLHLGHCRRNLLITEWGQKAPGLSRGNEGPLRLADFMPISQNADQSE